MRKCDFVSGRSFQRISFLSPSSFSATSAPHAKPHIRITIAWFRQTVSSWNIEKCSSTTFFTITKGYVHSFAGRRIWKGSLVQSQHRPPFSALIYRINNGHLAIGGLCFFVSHGVAVSRTFQTPAGIFSVCIASAGWAGNSEKAFFIDSGYGVVNEARWSKKAYG